LLEEGQDTRGQVREYTIVPDCGCQLPSGCVS
jgi:hypothetical protein